MPSVRFAVVLTATVCVTNVAINAQLRTDEVSLRAAYLSRFAQFIEWPAEKQSGPVVLCIAGGGRLFDEASAFAESEAEAARPLRTRAISNGEPIDACHVLYVPPSQRQLDRYLATAAARHVLTVGDGLEFLDAGGAVSLRVVDRRLRFDVDLGNLRRAGLRASSRLLRLAAIIRGADQ